MIEPAIHKTARHKPRSLQSRIFFSFGLAFALGIIAVDLTSLYGIPYTNYNGEYGQRRTEAFRDLGVLADNKKAELLQMISERRRDAVIFCESPLLRNLAARLSSELHYLDPALPSAAMHDSNDYRLLLEHLHVMMKTYPDLYQRVDVADAATGRVFVSTDRGEVGSKVALPDFPEMRQGVEDESISALKDPRSGMTNLVIGHTIRGAGNEENGGNSVTAILILYLKADIFVKALETSLAEIGKIDDIYLLNNDKILLTSLKRPLPDGTLPHPQETRIVDRAATLAVEGDEGVIATPDYSGVPVLAAFRHLRLNSEMSLGMVATIDQSKVFAPIRQLVVFALFKAAIFCLLALGLIYTIANRLTRPIRELSRTAMRVEEGDFDARAPIERDDEVGMMAVTFNAMVERIRDWHDKLEEEVRTRTVQLETVNAELSSEVVERRRAEEALRVSERRFRELLETVHMVTVILDLEGNIVFCNDFVLALTGWSREEVLGLSWFDVFIPEEKRSEVKTLFRTSLASGTVPLHYENPIITRSGDRRTIVWDNTLLRDSDGALTGCASLGIDVSEHRSLEEQLRHAQKMEAIGQLAGGVAHDFNNLLMGIIGNCELMKQKIPKENPTSNHLDRILTISDKAAKVTQSLLAFSRKQLLKIEPVDLNESVRSVASLLERVIGEDIELLLRTSEGTLLVMADRDQIEQVLINLATNARDAMPGGGTLIIETRRSYVDESSAPPHDVDEAGAYAVILVSDTGSGMDEAVRAKIFDPFFTTKEMGKGTGLGLSMVFGTIRQHSGHIIPYSEVGKGTIFKIYLPLIMAGGTVQNYAVDENNDVPGGKETLLVAEDDDGVREVTIAILREFGYNVIGAASGEEAISRFSENRNVIDMVILDIVMPKMNGENVRQALQKIRPDVMVLFISGYTGDIIREKLVVEHFHFLQKPIAARELLRKVREMLDGHAGRGQSGKGLTLECLDGGIEKKSAGSDDCGEEDCRDYRSQDSDNGDSETGFVDAPHLR